MQCGGIWIGGSGFGLTWRVAQMQIEPKQDLNLLIVYKDEDEDEQSLTKTGFDCPRHCGRNLPHVREQHKIHVFR
jgi:hypothetical protein